MSSICIPTATKDVRLFSALAAMGIPWSEDDSTLAIENKSRAWKFGEVSDCAKWKTKDLVRWWQDKTRVTKNPSCPFNVVKATLASDRDLRKAFREHIGWSQRKSGNSMVIYADQHADSADLNGYHATTDTIFASAAAGVGFEVKPVKETGQLRTMLIGPRSLTLEYTHVDISRWWHDATFEAKNPQHPYAYAKAVAITYHAAVGAITRNKELVKWKPKGSVGTAHIHPDCSVETEEKMAGWLKGE